MPALRHDGRGTLWAALGLLAMVVAACGNGVGTGTPSPAASAPLLPTTGPATPTFAPTAAAAPTPTAEASYGAPPVFAPDSIAAVIEGPLEMRLEPRVGEDVITMEPMPAGQQLFVISGPKAAGGFSWYLVRPVEGRFTTVGWVPVASLAGKPFLEPSSLDCPDAPSLDALANMGDGFRISCYGSRDFEFTDKLTWGPMCGDGNVIKSPEMYAGCMSTVRWGPPNAGVVLAIPSSLLAAAGEFEIDKTFRAHVVAHMDDAAAHTCVPHTGLEIDFETLTAKVVLDCRAIFVATVLQPGS